MAMTSEATNKDFLASLSRGGFAESLTPAQRRAIHIETDLDEFLATQVGEMGRQVVLTGNPGDGKTQHILRYQDQFDEENYFYLLDASEYADYTTLLNEWRAAYQDDRAGILAINDGPLHEMAADHADSYEFLATVQTQLENQIVYDYETEPSFGDTDILVVDLNNRNILTPRIIKAAIRTFAQELALDGHDHTGRCHIQYNAEKLQHQLIQENLTDLLWNLGKYDTHITVRDLINFLSYCITGGIDDCQVNHSDGLKYYNLAFEGTGQLFELLREHFRSEQLTHPFIDSQLWAAAEQEINPRDIEDAREEIEALFEQKKRQFLFEDEQMELGYKSRELFKKSSDEFVKHTQEGGQGETEKEWVIQRLNGYFMSGSTKRSELKIWLSHNYRSKSSQALVSRTDIPKRDFTLKAPQLHSKIADAIGYRPTYTVLEYTEADEPIRLFITKDLYQRLSALAADIPYTLRNRENEQQILEFMEEIEYYASYSETQGRVSIKDTETGRTESVEISDDIYRV